MRSTCLPAIVLLCLAGLAAAGETAPDLDVVLVTGEQPGPALWRVSSGEHDLWILGEVSPLPRRVQWRSRQFESLLANSQEVILHGGAYYARGKQAAELARASQGPPLIDIVSPELFARIEKVARVYGVNEPLERLGSTDVATRIANASLKSLDLRVVSLQAAVAALAAKAKVRITSYSVPETFEEKLQFDRDNAKSACQLERIVLPVLEDGGSGLRALANAWSVGDIDDLRRLMPEYGLFTGGSRWYPCATTDQQKQREEHLAKRTATWLVEAERALRDNQSTLAVVPMPELFATDGYLAALRARGYEVIEPE